MKQLKSVAVLLFISAAFSVNLFAQKDTTQYFVLGGFFTLPVEIPNIDNHEVNQRLAAIGFPEATHPASVIGIGVQLHLDGLITTFSFNKATKKTTTDTTALSVEYRSTSLNFGYDVLRHPYLSLYPYGGYKGAGLNYLIKHKPRAAETFDSYFQTKMDQKEISNSRAHLDVGIGFSHQLFYLLNIRLGYLLPLNKSRWKIDNNKANLENSPGVRYRSYISITLGLGNMVSERDIIRRNESIRGIQSNTQ